MLNALIRWSVANRLLVVAASVLLVVIGSIVGSSSANEKPLVLPNSPGSIALTPPIMLRSKFHWK